MTTSRTVRARVIGPDRRDEFVAKGVPARHFFPHRVYQLPKCGPDGYQLARQMCGRTKVAQLWELVLFAEPEVIAEFPADLFFDDDVVWHQQHLQRVGQVATASLVLDGSVLYSTVHQSDVVQRISRRREHKTRIEKRLGGWHHMLLNAIFAFASERGVRTVCTPTAELAIRNTDPHRVVQPELYERLYDRNLTAMYPARQKGAWWRTRIADASPRIVTPTVEEEALPDERTICINHDIEAGLGHGHDPTFAASANANARAHLDAMLAIEARTGVRATYNVVAVLLDEIRPRIEAGGHAVAFHSYDHSLRDPQLAMCRSVDYRIKGYRPPQSRITRELRAENLCLYNFEWLASSMSSLGLAAPLLDHRLVKLPILADEYSVFEGEVAYETWEAQLLSEVTHQPFSAITFHDCYGEIWLPHYERFLERVGQLGRVITMDQAAAEVVLSEAA